MTATYRDVAIVKGKGREVRRMLARCTHELLERYRRGEPVGDECPLKKALPSEHSGQEMFGFLSGVLKK